MVRLSGREILSHVSLNTVSVAIRASLGLLTLIVISQFYGTGDLGDYALAYVWSSCLLAIADYGFTISVPVYIARKNTNVQRTTAALNSARLFTTLVSALLLITLLLLDLYPMNDVLLVCVFLYLVPGGYYNYSLLFVRARGHYRNEAKLTLIITLASFTSFVLLAFSGLALTLALIICALLRLAASFFLAIFLNKSYHTAQTSRLDFAVLKRGAPNFALSVMAALYVYIDSIILGYYLDKLEMAKYQVAIQIVFGGAILGMAIGNVALQSVSSQFHNKDGLKRVISLLIRQAIISGGVLFFTFPLLLIYVAPIIFDGIRFSIVEAVIISAIIFLRVTAGPIGSALSAMDRPIVRVVQSSSAFIASLVVMSSFATFHHLSIQAGFLANLVAHSILVIVGLQMVNHIAFAGGGRR